MFLRMIVLMDEGEKDLGDLRGREGKRESGDSLHPTHIAQRTILLILILPIVTLTHILHRQTQHQVMKGEGGNRKETGIGEEKERGTIEERSNEDRKIKDQGTRQNGLWFDCLCGAFYFVVFLLVDLVPPFLFFKSIVTSFSSLFIVCYLHNATWIKISHAVFCINRSTGTSSDSVSESTSGRSDNEKVDGRGSAHKTSKSSQTAKKSLQVQGIPSVVRLLSFFPCFLDFFMKRMIQGNCWSFIEIVGTVRTWAYIFQSSRLSFNSELRKESLHLDPWHMLRTLDLYSAHKRVSVNLLQSVGLQKHFKYL